MQSNVRVSLGADRFRNDLKDLLPVLPGTKVGLAVSGGPDSMALAWLAQHTLHDVGLRIAVVDHGLRTDSAREAALVQERVAALGLHALQLQSLSASSYQTPKRGLFALILQGLR